MSTQAESDSPTGSPASSPVSESSSLGSRSASGSRNEVNTRQKVTVFGFLSLLIWQIFAKRFEYSTPADFLSMVSDYGVDIFYQFGNLIMFVYQQITDVFSIQDLAFAIRDLFRPLVDLALSPYQTFTAILDALVRNPSDAVISLGTGVFVTIAVALLAQRNLPNWLSPLTMLSVLKTVAEYLYSALGRLVGDLSSFYLVLKLDRVIDDFVILSKSYLDILVSPTKAVVEYLKSLNRTTIAFGSLTLFGLWFYAEYLLNEDIWIFIES